MMSVEETVDKVKMWLHHSIPPQDKIAAQYRVVRGEPPQGQGEQNKIGVKN